MIPTEAIEKAIDGGWTGWPYPFFDARLVGPKMEWQKFALDPSFWQSLGKALGWQLNAEPTWNGKSRPIEGWHYEARRFYDIILLNGGNGLKTFWDELLST
jgi:hypothetical protein